MTENLEHIDELFRSKLSEAQIEAPSGALEAIQNQVFTGVTQQAAVQATTSVWSTTVGLKIAGVFAVVGLSIGVAIWVGNDEEKQVKISPEKKEEELKITVPEGKPKQEKFMTDTVFGEIQPVISQFGDANLNQGLGDIEEQGKLVEFPVKDEVNVGVVNNNQESRNYVKNETMEEFEDMIQIEEAKIEFGANDDVKPNVFTPNGDGMNDSFFVELKSADFMELVVLNRAGMKVFGTTDKNRKWAGDHLGIPCAAGTYKVILKSKNRKTQEAEGDQWVLNLIR